MALAQPLSFPSGQLSVEYEVALLGRLLTDPPSYWNEENRQQLSMAMRMRYEARQRLVPAEIQAALFLGEVAEPSQNPLVKFIQRAGPRATATVEACSNMLASAETRDISYQQVASVILFMVIYQDAQAYNAKNFVAALRDHRTGQRIDWQDVVHAFDRDGLRITKAQFLAIYNALLPIAIDSDKFDIQLLWGGQWQNPLTQLSFLTCYLSTTEEELDVAQVPRLRPSFTLKTFEDAPEGIKAAAERYVKHPYVSLDAISALFGTIFQSGEWYHQAQVLGIPEAVINPYTAAFLVSAVAVPQPWGALQEQALKQLYEPYFTKKIPDHEFVLYGIWKQARKWLIERFNDSYNGDPMLLTLIFEWARAYDWLHPLIRSNTDISLDLAAQAHAHDLFDIEPWLQEILQQHGLIFRRILTNFLEARAEDEIHASRDNRPLTTLPLAVKTVHALLWFLAECGLPEPELLRLQRDCIQAYPRLINYGEGVDDVIDKNGENGNQLSDQADEKMQEHFKNMYGGESQVRDIINILRKYKESRDPAEQDLFACMIHGLFDEYNCFGEYPLEALATTAVLFGGIINFNLLSRIALQVGLDMVLNAVHDYRPDESMYKFGLQALLHFSNRLHEWPRYCERLLIVPGLQGTEIYAKAEEVVEQQGDQLNGQLQNGVGLPNGNAMDEIVQQAEPTTPVFSCLHVDPPLNPDLYEEPDEDIQDKVLFVLNNVSERNLREKMKDLTETVEAKHHQWFASYLVEERAKMQPNFQALYLEMLDLFNDKLLWAEVLRETYASVIRLLNGDNTQNTPEKTYLKNLGIWLGSLTLARDKPIKFRNISFKDLLIEGYDKDRLLIVIPFTCKVLIQAARSTVFKYPNPWLTEILRVLMELYQYAGLKLNQKFEIEVLCKGLEVDHNMIQPSDTIRTRPQVPEDEYLGPMLPDAQEPFSDLSIMSLNRARGPSERFSSAAITSTLPDFSNRLIYPPTNNSVVPSRDLKKIFLNAVQQAIQEIIAPVVERSVTIAAISTSQLISKDFAMEPDEEKLRSAAHTVVKSLSGALALVTCKEPLRMSIMNNIRVMARDLPEQALPEGHVLMFVNDNLDLVCNTVEQAAEVSSMNEIDLQIEEAVRIRRIWRTTRPNDVFKDTNVSQWALYIPEPYRQAPGGLNKEQLAIYEEFGRQSRGGPHSNNISQDSVRQLPDVLQDQFAPVPNLPTPSAAPAEARQSTQQSRFQSLQGPQAPPAPPLQQQMNGYMDHGVDRPLRAIEETIVELSRCTREAPEEHITDLAPNHPIFDAFQQLVYSIENTSDKDAASYKIAGQVTNHLFTDDLRQLEVEVFTRLLANLCQLSVQTSRQVLIWLATMQDDDRIFNTSVMLCLMEVDLMDLHRLNRTIAKAILQRRPAAVGMLSALLDEVLLCEHPRALRADFAQSIDALTSWVAEDQDLEIGKQVLSKMQSGAWVTATVPALGDIDQLDYVFEEWVQLQAPETPKKAIVAFIYQLHQKKIMHSREASAQFIRACLDASVVAFEQQEYMPFGTGNFDTATVKIDALGKLVVSLVVFHGDQDGAVKESKAQFLESILITVIMIFMHHQQVRRSTFNPKIYFRLFSTILCELNEATKDSEFAPLKTNIFLVVADAFRVLRPQDFQVFTYHWLTLISHRIFVPVMLEDSVQERATKERRWNTYVQLLETLFDYTGRLIKPAMDSPAVQNFYRGVLRVVLLLHHDYPQFLAENHFRLCNSLPMHAVQLRNLVVSAYPANLAAALPDPFTIGLKVNRDDGTHQPPFIRANIEDILNNAGIKGTLDSLLNSSEPAVEDMEKVINATYYAQPVPAGFELVPTTADPKLIHAIVLYIGNAALAAQSSNGFEINVPSSVAKLMDGLAKGFSPEARYHFISAIANQLRWPNAHTYFFSYALHQLFGPPNNDPHAITLQEAITRVLLERLLVHRPHSWGLCVTILELIKNPIYAFWDLPFVKAAPEVRQTYQKLGKMGANPFPPRSPDC
jgi:CCR4-NOT transcription complex subunit 1